MSLINNKTGIVVLAAGASARLGSPKQLLQYKGKGLLRHVVSEAVNSNAGTVIVVLGANAGSILKEIEEEKIYIAENPGWEEGMASSVRIGLNTLENIIPSAERIIFMVCDQPFVTSALLNDLISTQTKTGKPIVACNYGETAGPPALFHKSLFPELKQLKGDTGAKKIIQQHQDEVATVLFPQGSIDIDTRQDYQNLLKS